MDIEIVNRKENLLLNRIEVRFEVAHSGKPTPRKKDVLFALSETVSAKLDFIVLDEYATQNTGFVAQGVARIYSDKASMELAETIPRLKKGSAAFIAKKKAKQPQEAEKEDSAAAAAATAVSATEKKEA